MCTKFSARSPLRGFRFAFAWATWGIVTLVALGTFIAGVPIRFEQLRHTAFPAARASEQLTPDQARLLAELGFSVEFYAGYVISLFVAFALIYIAIAIFIFWRKSDDGQAIFVSLALICFGVTEAAVGDPLAARYPGWHWPVEVMEAFGTAAILIIFYVFPDGRFVPRWTRPLTVVYSGAILIWLFFPSLPSNPLYWETWQRNPLPSFVVFLFLFAAGVVAQVYRYRHISSPTERQQTKWVVYGFAAGFLAGNVRFLPLALLPWLGQPPLLTLLIYLVGLPVAAGLVVVLPISVAFSILRYRLWDIDVILSLTLLYTVLTASLGLVYLGSIGLCQWLILNTFTEQTSLTNQQAGGVLLTSTLIIAALFRPWQRRWQVWIDRRFFREKVDFQQAFTAFSAEVRLIIDLPELLQLLVSRVTELLHIAHGAVFLPDATGVFRLVEARDLPAEAAVQLPLESEALRRLQAGQAVSPQEASVYSLLLPLIAPHAGGSALLGVLALGPRLSEQPYSGEDKTLLLNLAYQAGTALAVAQLIEAQRQLEAYRASPQGRSKAASQEILAQPELALIRLHRLAQQAGQDAEQASLLGHLPNALDSLKAKPVADLAEGFYYIHASQFAPEMLVVGLRTLTRQLESALTAPNEAGRPWCGISEAWVIYRLCQVALEVEAIADITALQPLLQGPGLSATVQPVGPQAGAAQPDFFVDLAGSLAKLQPVVEALHTYERVETADDKLFYLARAIDRLGRCHWQISPTLKLPERLIKQQIVDRWTALTTTALQALQGRAELTVELVTRQVVAADQVALALQVANVGRSSAGRISLVLLPGPGYDVIAGQAEVDSLPVGGSVRRQFIIEPTGADTFLQLQFRIQYDDRERAGKLQTVTGAVRLQAIVAAFRPLVNPYAPGLPLRRDSPLFFGREDVFAFIESALASSTAGRVLVLLGQRRMGKTSLAQQLPARLGHTYVPVYLDGQALAIDPGMAGFFYDVAREIAQTLALPQPAAEAFQHRPSATFEREFLPQALNALGQRRLLLLFDEFEELEMRVTTGYLDPAIFSYLRHLMQHVDRLAFIFVGTHTLPTLNPTYWSAFFNVALHRRISYLTEDAARALITEPLAPDLIYDDLAVDKMLRATGGYPYFLQLLGHTLVTDANQARRNYIALAHVNEALGQVLEFGEAHFIFLWNQLTAEEQVLLREAARLVGQGTLLTLDALSNRLEWTEDEIRRHLAALEQREILRSTGGEPPVDEFIFDLLRLWVGRYSRL